MIGGQRRDSPRTDRRPRFGVRCDRERFHDLRHAAATFLFAQGSTLEDVKNLLGHSSIVLTSNT